MPPRSTKPSNPENFPGPGYLRLLQFDRTVKEVALWGGGLMLLGLTFLTVGDVILRYCCNAPIHGGRDIAKLMLLVMVAMSTAYSARTGGQVAIEVFSAFLGPRSLRFVDIAVRSGATAMLLVLAWRLMMSGLSAGRFGEASLTLHIPYAPFYHILAFGMLLYAVVLVVEIGLLLSGRAVDLQANGEGKA